MNQYSRNFNGMLFREMMKLADDIHVAEIGILGSAVVLLVAFLILIKSSDVVVPNSVKIAEATGFGKTAIGFLLAAFSTPLPRA